MPQNKKTETSLEVSKIFYDETFNCRGAILGHTVVSLAQELAKDGLLQRIIVAPYDKVPGKDYRIVAGHRRFLAAKSLHWTHIDSVILEGLTELEQHKINLIENIARKDLNIDQEAIGIQPYVQAGWTQAQIAEEFSQPKGWVVVRVALLKLEPEIRELAAAGILNQGDIQKVAAIGNKDERFAAVRAIKDAKNKGLSSSNLILKVKKVNPFKRKERTPHEIFNMNAHLMDHLGPCLASRMGAWCAGEISTMDLLNDIKARTEEEGGTYVFPQNYMQAS